MKQEGLEHKCMMSVTYMFINKYMLPNTERTCFTRVPLYFRKILSLTSQCMPGYPVWIAGLPDAVNLRTTIAGSATHMILSATGSKKAPNTVVIFI